MARLASKEKVGYYPTPPRTLELITALLAAHPGHRVRVLDPCCGEGEALAAAAARLTGLGAAVESYGVEISPARAQLARGCLTHVLDAAWEEAAVARGAFSALWLNPPYDHEAGTGPTKRAKRLEYIFLRTTYDRLQPGGVLVYIVPRHVLGHHSVATFLAGHFERLQAWQLPAGEYEVFHQVVLLAYRRRTPMPDPDLAAQLRRFGREEDVLPLLEEASARYVVPAAAAAAKFFFRKMYLTDAEVCELAAEAGAHTTSAWQDLVRVRGAIQLRPAMPLKLGHLSSIIAGGLTGEIPLDAEDGRRFLMKGRAVKVVDEEREQDDQGRETITRRERFVVKVAALDDRGDYTELSTPADLETFLAAHASGIGQFLKARYAPRYEAPTDAEWETVSGLGLTRPPLPGAEPGLLPGQKHAAIAASRVIRRHGYTTVVGEMGIGKTTLSCGVIALRDAFPALVLSPGHLLEKWKREIEATIPGAVAVIADSIADLEAARAAYRPGQKLVIVLGKERAKLGGGWEHAATPTHARDALRRLVTLYRCSRCGKIVWDDEAFPVIDFGRKRRRCTATVRRWVGDPGGDNTQGRWQEEPCGEPLYVYGTQYRRWPLARYIHRKMDGWFKLLVADEVHEYAGRDTDQGIAFHHLVSSVPEILALTGTWFNGYASSLFYLAYRLDRQVRRDFAMSEVSRWSSLFGRLEEVLKEREADDSDMSGTTRYSRTVKEFPGVSPQIVRYLLETTVFVRLADLDFDLPPFEEEIVSLPMTPAQAKTYSKLESDLRDRMLEALYQGDKGLLGVYLQTCLAWPNAAFRDEQVRRRTRVVLGPERLGGRRPRKSKVAWIEEQLFDVPTPIPAGTHLPKERWLVEFCRNELATHRKVLLFLRQTGERDLRPRLTALLDEAGLRAMVLPDTVTPRDREAWIARHVDEIDVLLVNPERVKTGLDLVTFPTVVFFEGACTYALTTMWQAQRRVWRLGQTRPVKAVYLTYEGTLEEMGLALVGEKFKATASLYGDDVASALAEDASDGNLLAELTKRALAQDASLRLDGLKGILSQSVRVGRGAVPVPTPVAPSPAPVTPAPTKKPRTLDELARLVRSQPRPKRPAPSAHPNQIALPLFG